MTRLWNWLLNAELALCEWLSNQLPTQAEIDWTNRRNMARWN